MADTLSPQERSQLMSRIRGKNTKPELVVRKLLHSMSYRFRLHRRDLLGNPDIVLPRHGVCIFVHGCFCHLHRHCKHARLPKTSSEWWRKKLEGNAARDKRHAAALRRLGWRVITIWECQTEKPNRLLKRFQALLRGLVFSKWIENFNRIDALEFLKRITLPQPDNAEARTKPSQN